MPYCRVVGEVAGRGRVGQDDVRGVPGAHPRGGRHRPLQGVWSGGPGALGGPGTSLPAHRGPSPARRTASYRQLARLDLAGRGRVGQDDVRGVPGPHPRGGGAGPGRGSGSRHRNKEATVIKHDPGTYGMPEMACEEPIHHGYVPILVLVTLLQHNAYVKLLKPELLVARTSESCTV